MPVALRLVLVLAALASLSACGRRGELERPHRPEVGAVPASTTTAPIPPSKEPAVEPGEGTRLDTQSPGSQEPGRTRAVGAKKRPFILDRLL